MKTRGVRYLTAALPVIFLLALSADVSHAALLNVFLTRDAQGQGNKGVSFRPVDEFGAPAMFELTAHTMADMTAPLDPHTSFETGTVCIKKGAGARDINGGGSSGISGVGRFQNEELIFTFDYPVLLENIILGLTKVKIQKDGIGFKSSEPIFFLSDTDNPGVFEYTVRENEIAENFIMSGKHEGFVDFSGLTSTIPDRLIIDAFKVRETGGHIAINFIATPTPEPTTLLLLGFGSLALCRKRRT